MKTDADYEGIRRTLAEYCLVVDDETKLEAIADLWAVDAVLLSNGSPIGAGRADITEWFANRFRGPEAVWRGKHLTLNSIIDLDGSSASVRSDWLFLLPSDDGPNILGTGSYLDKLVRESERWRFAVRDIVLSPAWLPAAVRP